jgi:predicted methyltransferase
MKLTRLVFAPLFLAACGGPSTPAAAPARADAKSPSAVASAAPSPEHRAIVDAADRDAADRALDAGRKPAALLDFCDVHAGMKVAELFAGGGYTSELLARAVGPTGVVYAENNKFVLERFAEKPWAERLGKSVMKNVVRVDRELDDPLPPEATGLDRVLMVLTYHDSIWLGTDRAKMNAHVLAALKPGGAFCVVDHSGRAGTGVTEVKTLHRIEQSVVVSEITAAGFGAPRSSDVWTNAGDTRDWNAAPFAAADKRGTTDRFALYFPKP